MHNVIKRYDLILALLMLTLPMGLWASDDPFIGTWELNIEKSIYEKSMLFKSRTLTFTPAENGGTQVSGTQVFQNDTTSEYRYTAWDDGKDYPQSGLAGLDSTALTRIDLYTVEFVAKFKGKVVSRGIRQVSKDRLSMTITFTPSGATKPDIHYYDKKKEPGWQE